MGLDLIPEGCARAGHEAEWRRLVEQAFAGAEPSDADSARFGEIRIPAYERVGAPRVGHDSAADDWIVKVRGAATPEDAAAVLKEFHGYHVLALATSDGVPRFSHGGTYEGVDETSFRGSFLDACGDVLPKDVIEKAWDHKFPDAAIEYGRTLLAAADAAALRGPVATPTPKPGLLARLGLGRKPPAAMGFDEQLDIVRTAGRWFVFWGERGHPIRAWY